jgi:hypothetical protein
VTGNRHNGLGFYACIGKVRGCTMPKIMKDKVFNPLLSTQPLDLPVGMANLSPVVLEDKALNPYHTV